MQKNRTHKKDESEKKEIIENISTSLFKISVEINYLRSLSRVLYFGQIRYINQELDLTDDRVVILYHWYVAEILPIKI